MVSILGTVIIVLGRYLIAGYLDPEGSGMAWASLKVPSWCITESFKGR